MKLFMDKEERIRQLASDMDYGCTKRDLYPEDATEIAKALDILGYRKTVWHKVADGDLPKESGCYLCYTHITGYDRHNKLIDGYGYSVEFFDTNFYAVNKAVIAWTELPEYSE